MARKRDGFVLLGDVAGAVELPGGRVLTPRSGTLQARHHFTMLDQVKQLVGASEADADLGFMARLMMLCSLPRTNLGDQLQYVRRNGPFTLYMTVSGGAKLPYGNLPRLLLAWVCTEAVRTQNRELILGDSLSDFMRKLDIYSTGGGVHARLRNQMQRLFQSHVQLVYKDDAGTRFVSSQIADSGEFWWDMSGRLPRTRGDRPVGINHLFGLNCDRAGAGRACHPKGRSEVERSNQRPGPDGLGRYGRRRWPAAFTQLASYDAQEVSTIDQQTEPGQPPLTAPVKALRASSATLRPCG